MHVCVRVRTCVHVHVSLYMYMCHANFYYLARLTVFYNELGYYVYITCVGGAV